MSGLFVCFAFAAVTLVAGTFLFVRDLRRGDA